MKKILVGLIVLLLLTGCKSEISHQNTDTQNTEESFSTNLKIISPSGAPALSLVDLFENNDDNVTIVEGSDVLQASFVNPSPEYDVIIAPTNLGVKLALAEKTSYRLAAVITWGNLYIVAENEEVLSSDELVFAAFGEMAVPGLVLESVKEQINLENVTYYNAVTEAQAALLSGNANAALIAEPAATATIAKAKEQGSSLTVVADVQKLWENKTGSAGYPQAGIFVLETESNTEEIDALLNEIEQSMNAYASNDDTTDLINAIDLAGAQTLGVPNAQIVAKAYSRMGLRYVKASECEKELTDFLSLFNISYDSKITVR